MRTGIERNEKINGAGSWKNLLYVNKLILLCNLERF